MRVQGNYLSINDMPLVAHNNLPTFSRLRHYGLEIMKLEDALHQDIRELHIGLLNMMPDAALAATEQQFIRLVGNCNKIAQFYVYPFSVPGIERGETARAHIAEHYFDFEDLKDSGLDALIITGANVINPALDQEPFWDPLMEVVQWADENVASILCSCLATHALVKKYHGIERQHLPKKHWGVYQHQVLQVDHPLVRDINTRFDAPHSRFNTVEKEELEKAGLCVLAAGEEAGVHLAVSPDLFRKIYFQGHPEYDSFSLLKEYKREVFRYLNGELDAPPPYPEHYFSATAIEIAQRYIEDATAAREQGSDLPEFPEERLLPLVDNTWRDTGKAIFNNWLGLVYRKTNLDRTLQYMDDVDPSDPLQLLG
ncbi:MAG: homoserine O-succinyltransferase [Lysobacterales bacterium]